MAQTIGRGRGPGPLTGGHLPRDARSGPLRTTPPSPTGPTKLPAKRASRGGAGQVASRLRSAHPTARSPRPPSRRRNPGLKLLHTLPRGPTVPQQPPPTAKLGRDRETRECAEATGDGGSGRRVRAHAETALGREAPLPGRAVT